MDFFAIQIALPNLTSFSVALLCIVATKLVYDLSKRSLQYPPGPKPKFLIGNALDLPMGNASRVFAEWGRKYDSDLLYVSAFGIHVAIINGVKMAEEIFEKRARLYSDRPVIPIVEVFGSVFTGSTPYLRYGDVWRQHRKICWQNFHSNAATKYRPIQRERIHLFLRHVLQTPERVFEHSNFLSISIAMLMMYGYTPESFDDPIIRIIDEGGTLGAPLIRPGGTLINVLPVLRKFPSWVPGATGKRLAEKVRLMGEEMMRIPMERTTTDMKAGTAAPSLVADFLEKKSTIGATPEEETAVKNIAWTVYGVASDTIVSATGTFFYVIAKYPHIQRKAQEEIDRVVGKNCIPDLNDRPNLPYIEAMYREVLRFEPPASIVPHSLVEDDDVDGYFIPKGTIVLSNIWAMTHDEKVYPDPFTFKPERFFNADGTLNDDSRVLAYGLGRRKCVGEAIASDTIWLIIASFLACFNVSKAKDEYGNIIELDDSYSESRLLIHKTPFKCSIVPRSEQIPQAIESAMNY